jgi:hypothetical protein
MATAPGLHRFVTRGGTPAVPLRFTQPRQRPIGEFCEMCGSDVLDEHSHVVDIDSRRLLCTCRPCALLFTAGGAGRGHYRTVPERYLFDPNFELSAQRWEELQVPVAIAFFFHNSVLDRVVAHYPSPAGATESLLDLSAWDAIWSDTSLAAALTPDVEALVIRRDRGGQHECFLIPIDACYELVGKVRMHWSGFDGGAEVRTDLDAFFARIRDRARPLTPDQIEGTLSRG